MMHPTQAVMTVRSVIFRLLSGEPCRDPSVSPEAMLKRLGVVTALKIGYHKVIVLCGDGQKLQVIVQQLEDGAGP